MLFEIYSKIVWYELDENGTRGVNGRGIRDCRVQIFYFKQNDCELLLLNRVFDLISDY